VNAIAVRADGLIKSFGDKRVLDRLSFEAAEGTVLGLLGPNGAGKTTAVRILATLVAPDDGHAEVFGHDVRREARVVRRLIGLTGQYAAVDDLLSARENLRMIGRLLGLRPAIARARADELLAAFSLTEQAGTQVKSCSGGMRRRLDLAASLVGDPRVLFLDEPTTGLDVASRGQLWELIGRLAQAGTTVLLTTQYLEEADRLASRVVVIDHGRVVAEGTPDELKRLSGGQMIEVRPTVNSDLPEVSRILTGVAGTPAVTQGDAVKVPVTDPDLLGVVVHQLSAERIPVSQAGLRLPSMDEAFLHITSEEAFR
jgi:oleandomycin transport system ATP-binding protein